MDRNELKSQALLERVSEISTTFESRVADLRVEITLQSQEIAELKQENERLKNELASHTEDTITEDADPSK